MSWRPHSVQHSFWRISDASIHVKGNPNAVAPTSGSFYSWSLNLHLLALNFVLITIGDISFTRTTRVGTQRIQTLQESSSPFLHCRTVAQMLNVDFHILEGCLAKTSVSMLNARLAVSDGLKKYRNKPEFVLITRELLTLAQNAHRSYQNYLQEEKRARTEKEKRRRNREPKKRKNEKKCCGRGWP